MGEEDLEQLYARLETPLCNLVYRWLWSMDESQDVVQDAFVRLWRMRARVDKQTVEPLIYKIALNLAASRRCGGVRNGSGAGCRSTPSGPRRPPTNRRTTPSRRARNLGGCAAPSSGFPMTCGA